MPPRFFVPLPLATGDTLGLPAGAARHAQVLRLQPGDTLTLFDGKGGEYAAEVLRMGRSDVDVRIGAFDAVERELPFEIVLAFGMPANDRMDWLVEKATELGAAALQPLVCERSVLRLTGERAEKKRLHWQAVAAAASEQSRRTRVPSIGTVQSCEEWLDGLAQSPRENGQQRCLLSTQVSGATFDVPYSERIYLSGPEGGLTAGEERLALQRGFRAVSLGERVLRADTAPIAALAVAAAIAATTAA